MIRIVYPKPTSSTLCVHLILQNLRNIHKMSIFSAVTVSWAYFLSSQKSWNRACLSSIADESHQFGHVYQAWISGCGVEMDENINFVLEDRTTWMTKPNLRRRHRLARPNRLQARSAPNMLDCQASASTFHRHVPFLARSAAAFPRLNAS